MENQKVEKEEMKVKKVTGKNFKIVKHGNNVKSIYHKDFEIGCIVNDKYIFITDGNFLIHYDLIKELMDLIKK